MHRRGMGSRQGRDTATMNMRLCRSLGMITEEYAYTQLHIPKLRGFTGVSEKKFLLPAIAGHPDMSYHQ